MSVAPASSLERSRMSLIRSRSAFALMSMPSVYSRRLSLSTSLRERNSAKPMTALRGVRSSCDIIARKRVFALACSSAAAADMLALNASRLRRRTIYPLYTTIASSTRSTTDTITLSIWSPVSPNTLCTTLRSAAALMNISCSRTASIPVTRPKSAARLSAAILTAEFSPGAT